MANDIDEIFSDIDARAGGPTIPLLFEHGGRIVTTAHPFTEDDLNAFRAAGEHTGLE